LRISAGTFSNNLTLEGRVDGTAAFDGSERDFDDELDFGNRRSVELLELGWRPFERHEVNLRHYRDARRRTAVLNDELRFAGEVFPFAVEVEGRAAFQALEFSYTGWIHSSPRSALGVQLGVLRLSGSLSIAGEIRSQEFGVARGKASVSDRLHAPLIGLSARHVLVSRVRVFADARAIRLNHEGIDGSALSATAGVEFFATRSLALVLQYSDTWVEAERRSSNFSGRLEVGFSGPQALLRSRM
jgi:hypothetical protein